MAYLSSPVVLRSTYRNCLSLLLLIVLSFFWQPLSAQVLGANMSNPIVASTIGSCGGSFSDTRSNADASYGNDYGQPSVDIYYRFTLTASASVTISHCGSGFDTYMHLLNSAGVLVTSNDDNYTTSTCPGTQAYIQTTLAAGTYYVVSEGFGSYTGNLITTISVTGSAALPAGANMSNAINAGTFSSAGSFSDTRSNADVCMGNDYGQASNDIYYRFTLTNSAKVTLSHCGTTFDTYMHLLNSSGVLVASNDDNYTTSPCPGSQAYIEQAALPAGTYYVVSEGYSSNTGNITTTINVLSAVSAAVPVIAYSGPATFFMGTQGSIMPVNTGGATYVSEVTTFAGSGVQGSTNGTGTAASFYNPYGIAGDNQGNLYVSDTKNNKIRKISSSGVVTTFAGSGTAGSTNGSGTAASFNNPCGIALDGAGNVYVADRLNNMIRKISSSGVVTTLSGTGAAGSTNATAPSSSFNSPYGVAVDGSGNVYVADEQNHKIRKISAAGSVSTLAGTGFAGHSNGTNGTFYYPRGIVIDASGNLLVSEISATGIRQVTPLGVVSTLPGVLDPSSSYSTAVGLAVDGLSNVYIADANNSLIRKLTPEGVWYTLAGSGMSGSGNGPVATASFSFPTGLTLDASGNIFVVDSQNNKIRRVQNSPGFTISPALPQGLSFNSSTGEISGTATVLSAATVYTITAYNSAGNGTATLVLSILPDNVNPSPGENYILSFSPRSAVSSTELLKNSDVSVVNKNIQYFDGLGRPMQNIQVQGSPTRNDIIQPFGYDKYGRKDREYLPYTTSAGLIGNYRSDAINAGGGYAGSAQKGFYGVLAGQDYTPTASPFSLSVFEASSLERVVEQGAPGETWQPVPGSSSGHTVKTDYSNNVENEVRLWTVSATGSSAGYYLPGKLFKTILKDENWQAANLKAGTIEEFKDLEGHIVLKRIWENDTKSLSTYYIYDNYGNLRYVLPPAVNENGLNVTSFTEASDAFINFMYGYHYDSRNRVIEKKIPGKNLWDEVIYNLNDQVVLTRDPVQRTAGYGSYTKYDALGRVVITGMVSQVFDSRENLQATVNGYTSLWETRDNSATNYQEYSNVSYPSALLGLQPFVVNYYDNYNIPGLPNNQSASYSGRTKGLLTATRVKVLRTANNFLWTVNYYDGEDRLVKVWQQHYLGGTVSVLNYDEVVYTYSFTGEVLTTTRKHYVGGVEQLYVYNEFTYDHQGRSVLVRQKTGANSGTVNPLVVLSTSRYNEIGGLKEKDYENDLYSTFYTYNERGWLSTSTSGLFSSQLKYQDGVLPQYNGNISGQVWNFGGSNAGSFAYSYDKLNRLLSGVNTGSNTMTEVMTYDLMGNITSLSRNGGAAAAYSYNGNRLNQVNGVTGIYGYDANGNTTADGRNGVTLEYNVLNLPEVVTKTGLNLGYTYNANGVKLARVNNDSGVAREYIDGIEYNGATIELVHTSEGIARNNGGVYSYEYNQTDHLGNVRVSFHKNPVNGLIEPIQKDDYFPFGKRKSVSAGQNNYLYNGKELQNELGSAGEEGQYDYGARFYDPVIGRWNVVDPLAEKGRRWSPYTYAFNNPIRFVDPDGMWPDEGDGPDDPDEDLLSVQIGMAIGAAIRDGIHGIRTLVAAAGDIVGINKAAPGMKWQSVDSGEDGNLKFSMTQVPSEGGLRDALGHLGDGANALAFNGSLAKSTTGTLLAKTGQEGTATNAGIQSIKDGTLVRFGQGPESFEKLAADAAKAEAAGFPHGVSTKLVTKPSSSDLAHRLASKSSVEKIFKVQQTGNKVSHHTVHLPKPVTQQVADWFNNLFK